MTEEKYSVWQRFARWVRKWDKKTNRWLTRHLRRGVGYRLSNYFRLGFIAFLALFIGVILELVAIAVHLELDWSTVFSIMFADIPVGLVLWFILDRSESAERKLLDAIEIVEAPTRYTHLQVHYCHEYNSGIYPELLYYIVNTRTNSAYWVDERTQELIEARIIRIFPKHRDIGELNRHFDHNGIKPASGYPQGDDLFRGP